MREYPWQLVTQRNKSGGIVGAWEKTSASSCDEKYPGTITFAGGTYRGVRGANQGMIWWDAGIYRLEGENTLVVSVATDELVRYQINLRDDLLEVTDAEGCRFSYRRKSSED